MGLVNLDAPTKKWDGTDQCQLCHEALKWLDFKEGEIEGTCFKKEQYSIQKGIKKFDKKVKMSAMKEICNLASKIYFFGEVDYDKLSQEMKDKALFILMLVIMKRNGEIKSRGYTNGSCQRVCIDKNEHTSPALEFCSVKHARGVVGKE